MAKTSQTEHVLRLCLPAELRVAVIKFQAANELGEAYAGLLLLTKQLYQEKLIDRETYEVLAYRYSRKLREDPDRVKPSWGERQDQEAILEKTYRFKEILSCWSTLDRELKTRWVKEAQKFQERIPAAKMIVALDEKQQRMMGRAPS